MEILFYRRPLLPDVKRHASGCHTTLYIRDRRLREVQSHCGHCVLSRHTKPVTTDG